MNKALETLKERGFFQQCTDVEGLSRLMDAGPVTFYVGFDPTGSSLHIGHMLPAFALRHLRNSGHRGIALIGGDDQWGNIVAGIELVRRINGNQVYGLTFPLVTTSDGKKMGKTEKGALFLDPAVTTAYEFFQYWRNVTDADTRKFLLLFTFLPVAEIDALLEGNVNAAKERLAYEVTVLIHGRDEADKALAGAKAAFSGGGDKSSMPTVKLDRARFTAGIGVVDLFFEAGLAASKSDVRRLVEQGGAAVAEKPVTDVKATIGADALDADGEVILRAGKKKFIRVITC